MSANAEIIGSMASGRSIRRAHWAACYTRGNVDTARDSRPNAFGSPNHCMTDSGLTSRLRQQSRRTGLAVGLAMALTIAVCVGSFVIIYAQVDPFTRDFVAAPATSTPAPKPTSTKNDTQVSGAASTGTTDNANTDQSIGNPPEPTATSEAAPTSTPGGFKADYHSNDETAVNFRSQPTTDSEVLLVLDAGTLMQSTGNKLTDDGGTVWMEFKLQDNSTGWIREIDAIPEG